MDLTGGALLCLFSLHGEHAGKEHVGGEMRFVLVNHLPPIKKSSRATEWPRLLFLVTPTTLPLLVYASA
jgi:hypothetical protein